MNISIIIPTFNEEDNIQKLIYYLKINSSEANIKEIIVSDGGSEDGTQKLAYDCGARVVSGKKGRSRQLNEGAKHASGDILYFLHADSIPPIGFDLEIISRINAKSEAGCFIMKFDNQNPWMKLWGWLTKFTGPYFRGGDQSLFVSQKLFKSIQGFNSSLLIMEDYDIVHRLMKITKFCVIRRWITTSARKYEKVGFLKLQFRFGIIYLMYAVGFTQDSLIKYYSKHIKEN